jgi:hypothetical protein
MTRDNVFASFSHLRQLYQQLVDIDAAFRMIVQHLKNPGDWFPPLFLLRAHSSYLGAAHLSLAGQLPEAYMLLRGSIENGLYGFYFMHTPASHERWLRRHDNDATKKSVQDEFRIRALLRLLSKHDNRLGEIAGALYERTIDFGAHPNERALSQVIRLTQTESERRFHVNYLTGHTTGMDLCLKSTAQAGVLVLKVFQRVYPERYDLIGLATRLDTLQQNL